MPNGPSHGLTDGGPSRGDASGPPIRVRDAAPAERDAVRALTRRAYAPYATRMAPDAWRALAAAVDAALAVEPEGAGAAAWLVAVSADAQGAPLGSVLLYPAATDAYAGLVGAAAWPTLRLLSVAPEAQGRGIGRALVEECVRRARLAGAPALGLHTSASMRAAIALYERMGFVREPTLDFQPPGAERVTAYRLPLGDRA